jgi:HK97 family phage prohead protease
MERRLFLNAELRASKSGPAKLEGYAATYGVRTKLPKFREVIAPGAFDRALAERQRTVLTVNHDDDKILGATDSGTLELRADKRGLKFSCEVGNQTYARDCYESVQRGDLNGCSFAFTMGPGDDEWTQDFEDDEGRTSGPLRTIRNVATLRDVAIVTHPAYQGTEVAARHTQVSAECRSALDEFLRVHPPARVGRIAKLYQRYQIPRDMSIEDAREILQRNAAMLREVLD